MAAITGQGVVPVAASMVVTAKILEAVGVILAAAQSSLPMEKVFCACKCRTLMYSEDLSAWVSSALYSIPRASPAPFHPSLKGGGFLSSFSRGGHDPSTSHDPFLSWSFPS